MGAPTPPSQAREAVPEHRQRGQQQRRHQQAQRPRGDRLALDRQSRFQAPAGFATADLGPAVQCVHGGERDGRTLPAAPRSPVRRPGEAVRRRPPPAPREVREPLSGPCSPPASGKTRCASAASVPGCVAHEPPSAGRSPSLPCSAAAPAPSRPSPRTTPPAARTCGCPRDRRAPARHRSAVPPRLRRPPLRPAP